MTSWDALSEGRDNPLSQLLSQEGSLTALLDPAEIRRLLDPSKHVGTAPQRARELAARIDTLPPFPAQLEVRVDDEERS